MNRHSHSRCLSSVLVFGLVVASVAGDDAAAPAAEETSPDVTGSQVTDLAGHLPDEVESPGQIGIPVCEEPTVRTPGPRHIEITPQFVNRPVAILITGNSNDVGCVSGYVQAAGVGGGTQFRAVRNVGPTPHFAHADEWGTVLVKGDWILPSRQYAVQTICFELTPSVEDSTPVIAQMALNGDVIGASGYGHPDGSCGLMDVLAVLERFGPDLDTVDDVYTDLMPCEPNSLINLDDILMALDSFGPPPPLGPPPPDPCDELPC